MKRHFNFIVHGKVQGVGFRFSCAEAAYRYGILGFVKNRPNGTVYIEAEGEDENIAQFRNWCKKGPLWAQVSELEEEQGTVIEYTSFEIKR